MPLWSDALPKQEMKSIGAKAFLNAYARILRGKHLKWRLIELESCTKTNDPWTDCKTWRARTSALEFGFGTSNSIWQIRYLIYTDVRYRPHAHKTSIEENKYAWTPWIFPRPLITICLNVTVNHPTSQIDSLIPRRGKDKKWVRLGVLNRFYLFLVVSNFVASRTNGLIKDFLGTRYKML
jgi:hypothetical protein